VTSVAGSHCERGRASIVAERKDGEGRMGKEGEGRGRTSHGERNEHDGTVDVHRDLLVATHRLVVRVGDGAVAETLDGAEDGLPVPDSDVGEGRSDGEVACGDEALVLRRGRGEEGRLTAKVVDRVRRRIPRKALLCQRCLVQAVVGVEDRRLVVLCAVLVEEILREEGVVLSLRAENRKG
jgi:hypothetical protein